jgi:hypothetical protein
MKRFLAIFMAGGLAAAAAAQNQDPREGAGGVIFGPGFAFIIGAPEDWIFDSESAALIGSRAVIYPAGTDLNHTQVIIHANALPLNTTTLEQWIEQDITSLVKEFPGIVVTKLKTLITNDTLTATVWEFDPAKSSYGLYERIAYIDIGENVAIISLSAQSKKVYNESIQAFEYVVTEFRKIDKELLEKAQPK